MDINLTKNQLHSIIKSKTLSFQFKLNQQLEVKVLSSKPETKTLTLQLGQSKNSLQVQSETALQTKQGELIQLIVTRPSPNAEFKIVNQTIKPQNLKQIVTDKNFTQNHGKVNHKMVGSFSTAKIISISHDKIQLEVFNHSSTKNTPKHAVLNRSILTLSKQQFSLTTKNNLLPLSENRLPDLKQGQIISFEAIKTGKQVHYILKDNVSSTENTIFKSIKQNIPIQASPADLINHLFSLSKLSNNSNKLSKTLQQLASQILSNTPDLKDFKNINQLDKSVFNSGLFMETKLTSFTDKLFPHLKSDLKAQLLKLYKALEHEHDTKKEQKASSLELSLLKEIQNKTENTLAKIILNQLSSLPKEEGPKQVWVLDLPFMHKEKAESVKIEINRQNTSREESKDDNWSVEIVVSPPNLSTICCKITCFDNTINTHFKSNSQETVDTIKTQLEYLKNQFQDAGLNVGQINAQFDNSTIKSAQNVLESSIFDEQV